MNLRQAKLRLLALRKRAHDLQDDPPVALLAASGALWAPCTLPLRRRRLIDLASEEFARNLWNHTRRR